MDQHITYGLLCFTSFLTLVNPLGTVPVFMSMTSSLDRSTRNKVATKASITAFMAMLIFAFFGQWLFQLFGISINGLRIVGGVLFFTMGFDMLQGENARTKSPKNPEEISIDPAMAVTPLGIPLICGPGAITNAIVLMGDAKDMISTGILVGSMFLICLIMLISLRASAQIIRVLGETGNRVMVRLMGLIIMVIAVEFFFAGLKPIVQDILKL